MDHQPIFREHEGNRAVRDGKWKLVSYYSDAHQYGVGGGKRTGPWELYNIEADRTELHDLIDANPKKAKKMMAMYNQWADRVGVIDWEEINRRTDHL